MSDQSPRLGIVARSAAVLLASVVVAAGWSGLRAWGSWRSVERVSFDATAARAGLESGRVTVTTVANGDDIPPPASINPSDDVLTFLIIGSDQQSETTLNRRADVILIFALPPGDADPLLFSIPRDLWLPNPCTGGMSRVNANLNGCRDLATGSELLAVAVEDFTGIGVDHFALFDFDGFQAVIDRVGGVEICVERAVRDHRAGLELPAGCTNADGAQALAWVRSRHTQELVGGQWRLMRGVDDLARNQRQQEMILQALARLKGFRNISELSALVNDLAEAFTIDEGLGLGDAVSLAWNLRALDPDRIVRLVIPTTGFMGTHGEAALRATEPFADTLRATHPNPEVFLSP